MSYLAEVCNQCGAKLRPGTTFCESCGFAVTSSGAARRGPSPGQPPGGPFPPPPPAAGTAAPSGRVQQREPAPSPALAQFRTIVIAAGAVALIMLLVEVGFRFPVLLAGWIGTGIFVAWRCFISVPSALKRQDYTIARRALLLPAILNIVFLGVIPGVIMLVAFFRSDAREMQD